MFSGIIEATSAILDIFPKNNGREFTIKTPPHFDDLQVDASIAINGTCLTITHLNKDSFKVFAIPETLKKTNLDLLKVNQVINLERSLKINSRLSGHFVQGHVDEKGQITSIDLEGDSKILKINLSNDLSKYLIDKGFITIDGMSITIVTADKNYFQCALIPHTLQNTIAKDYQVGDWVNLEIDMFAKWVEKYLEQREVNFS